MIYNVETFAKIQQAEKGNLILIISQENAIGNCNQCRFGGMMGAEAVLGVREEVVVGEVVVKLALYNTFNYLGYDGDDGYGSEVGRIGRISGFVDRIDERVFPLFGNVALSEARVNNAMQDRADHRKAHLDHIA